MEEFTEEKLILFVQEYTNLYDLGNTNYHNSLIRENSWEEIGQRLKTPGPVCKNKWKSLRESYRKAMNARKTKSGQAAKKVKPWRLEAQMEFVKPHLFSQSDDQSSNIPPLPESPASVASSCHDLSLNDEELGNREAETPASSDRDTPSTSSENRTKTRKPTPSGTAAEMLRHYIDMKMSSNFPPASKIPSGDHLTKYFQSIEETVRTLPPHIQIRLKSQISQLVHNAELEAVSVNFSTPPSAYPLSPFPSSLSVQQSFPIPSANFYPTTSDNQPPPNQSNIPIQSAQSNNQSFSCPPPANYSTQYNGSMQ